MKRSLTTLLGAALVVLGAGCGTPASAPATDPTTPRVAEPAQDPLTGWVTSFSDSTITVQPFRTLGNGPAGKAYAEEVGMEFPFPNDHHDVAAGPPREAVVGVDTVCTGVIRVSAGQPVHDQVVPCQDLAEVVRASSTEAPVPAALWFDGETLVRLSELYRP